MEARLELLVDLHRHLDGSLRRSTLEELAAKQGLVVPKNLRFRRGGTLREALERFQLTLAVLQEPSAVRRVADEICQDAQAEGVGTLEIRFAPQLHRAAALEAIVEATVEGAAGRAGIVLCGLYGETPEQLERLVRIGASIKGVVGIDLAGGPTPDHGFRLEDYARPFQSARELGLGRTVHAAEGRPPQEIRVAIDQLSAQRIGHGTTLLDDPTVVDCVLSHGITIEACISSNADVGAIADPIHHPLVQWLKRGIRATVCTDNTLFSQTTVRNELELAQGLPNMTPSLLQDTIRFGHEAAF